MSFYLFLSARSSFRLGIGLIPSPGRAALTPNHKESWVCAALIYQSSQHMSCRSESSFPLPIPWSGSEDEGSPGAGGWALADLWLCCPLHESHPSLFVLLWQHCESAMSSWVVCLCTRVSITHSMSHPPSTVRIRRCFEKGDFAFCSAALAWYHGILSRQWLVGCSKHSLGRRACFSLSAIFMQGTVPWLGGLEDMY